MKRSLIPVDAPLRRSPSKEELEQILHRHFGFPHFRGKQLDAIQSVLSGRDCFCLMPTGGGKSLCYQIPALARHGLVLVISPLIALMENQVAALKAKRIPAEFLSSSQSAQTRTKIHEDLDSGNPKLKLLYVTPELVATSGFKTKLAKLHHRGLLSLVAIDEAHCISSWGHDFRPSYRKLESLRSHLQGVPLLALTATAAPEVRSDVIESLRLHQPVVLTTSFNRPNIFYEVRYKDLLDDPYLDLFDLIRINPRDCTIVYCHERSVCDELSAYLSSKGLSSAPYHAGLNNTTRSDILQKWISSRIQVVVATVAFGMGIDREDVRLVCHYNIPKSMESFYQESGRCGRDQLPSRSVLYFGVDDRRRMEFIISNSGRNRSRTQDSSTGASSRNPLESFSQMVNYCEGTGCRRKKILECFGEKIPTSVCQKKCDTCKYPDKVAACLEQLDCLQRNGFASIVFKSTLEADQYVEETEFWNREDDEDFPAADDEDISDSDDAIAFTNSFTRTKASSKSRINERIDQLQQAEERYSQKKDHNKKAGTLSKNAISDSQREAVEKRLLDTLEKNKNLTGNLSVDMKSAASFLEKECYKKFGKVGKSFYNSEAASTIRWLSTASSSQINDRLHPISSQSVTCCECDSQVSPTILPVSSSEINSQLHPVSSQTITSSQEAPTTSLVSSGDLGSQVVDSNNSEFQIPHGSKESAPVDLPPIPSFSEFRKLQASTPSSSNSLSKRSTADILKRMVPKEGSEKRARHF